MRFFFIRLLQAIVTLWVIASLSFFLLRGLPGGPFDEESPLPTPVRENLERKYGLARPLGQQYAVYLGSLLRLDFGQSYRYEGRSVGALIAESLPVSLQLGGLALTVALAFGISLGALAASHYGGKVDSLLVLCATFAISLPSFLLAPLLISMLSFAWPVQWALPQLHAWLREGGYLLPAALWLGPAHMILPTICLALRPMALILRLTRASVLDVMESDYVRTAYAKGLQSQRVLFLHVLRNSLVPVVTFIGPLAASLLSGSLVIEMIFAIPGLGRHLVQGVFARDYPLVLGVTLVTAGLTVGANLLVDFIYRWLDPRMEVR